MTISLIITTEYGRNYLLLRDGKIVAIDNEQGFLPSNAPSRLSGDHLSQSIKEKMENTSDAKIRQELRGLVPEEQIEELIIRKNYLIGR